MTDAELLRAYLEHADERAFARLVERHLAVVYGAALRQCHGDVVPARRGECAGPVAVPQRSDCAHASAARKPTTQHDEMRDRRKLLAALARDIPVITVERFQAEDLNAIVRSRANRPH